MRSARPIRNSRWSTSAGSQRLENDLPEAQRARLRVLLVSLDPDRDTEGRPVRATSSLMHPDPEFQAALSRLTAR